MGDIAEPTGAAERIIRVFSHTAKASPDDEPARFGSPDLFAEADEVPVSVAFAADQPKAEWLTEAWRVVAPLRVGGVAHGTRRPRYRSARHQWETSLRYSRCIKATQDLSLSCELAIAGIPTDPVALYEAMDGR